MYRKHLFIESMYNLKMNLEFLLLNIYSVILSNHKCCYAELTMYNT